MAPVAEIAEAARNALSNQEYHVVIFHHGLVMTILIAQAIRNVDAIQPNILRSYFSFMQGVKSANSELFKDFYNEAEMKKNK